MEILEGNRVVMGDPLRARIAEYVSFLHEIGQEQVEEAIASTLVRMKLQMAKTT